MTLSRLTDLRLLGRTAFLVTAAAVVAMFLWVSDSLVRDLARQERERMQLWADATREMVRVLSADDGAPRVDVDFLLGIIEANTTIPVLLTDGDGNILQHRNFTLPEPVDSMAPMTLSAANEQFLKDKLAGMAGGTNVIDFEIAPGIQQHLFYEDSTLLRRLTRYPYIQVVVMLVFIAVVYFAVLSTKKAEQNKVWVGLSKETAHQLGTPISSLMAWMELLPDMGVDSATMAELNKDVQRLSSIASRFSKIGSRPQMEECDMRRVIDNAAGYMSTRVSGRISLTSDTGAEPVPTLACTPLFEWVMENLIKNAVDAMSGTGSIAVTAGRTQNRAYIEVSDTGKGIARKHFKAVFSPGFTTKKRGWGLGLTLARRIVEQYHDGRIFVKCSTPGAGTTFRIELPLAHNRHAAP